MIEGKTLLQEILFKMNASEYCFVLTGSRYFVTNSPTSDYDYFTEDTNDVRDFLYRNSFGNARKGMYDDVSVSAVFRHPEGVDVQLLKEGMVQRKRDAQRKFKECGLVLPTRWDWDTALSD